MSSISPTARENLVAELERRIVELDDTCEFLKIAREQLHYDGKRIPILEHRLIAINDFDIQQRHMMETETCRKIQQELDQQRQREEELHLQRQRQQELIQGELEHQQQQRHSLSNNIDA